MTKNTSTYSVLTSGPPLYLIWNVSLAPPYTAGLGVNQKKEMVSTVAQQAVGRSSWVGTPSSVDSCVRERGREEREEERVSVFVCVRERESV